MKTLGFEVIEPGVLSLLQDQGRFGYAHLGMTTGGPVDTEAYHWNRVLLDNPPNPTLIPT